MVQVVIIGAGLGGPVLALSLHKQGITSAIYELRPASYQAGGNIAMAPNASRVLDHVGVLSRIRTQGYSYEELFFENGAGERLGAFLNGSQTHYNFSALRIHRAILHSELLKACEERGIPVHYKKRFKGFVSETAQDVTAEFVDGERVTAEYVVGCDGIHSKVRDQIQKMTPEYSGLMGIMGKVMVPELESLHEGKAKPAMPCMMFGSSGSFAIIPSNFDGSEIGYFATLEAHERDREEWEKLGTNTEQLKKMLTEPFDYEGSNYPDLVKELCKKTPLQTLSCWPFFSVPHLDSWTSKTNRVIVIGDAAHAIPPTGGQGAAQAFEDAETLAYTLRNIYDLSLKSKIGVAASGGTPTSQDPSAEVMANQLGKWQRYRQERIAKVMAFTTKNGTMRKSSPHFGEQAAKEWIIWATFKLAGPEGGARWLYTYNAESVLSALA